MQEILIVNGVECKTKIINGLWNVIIGDKLRVLYKVRIKTKNKTSINGMRYVLKLKSICILCGKEFFGILSNLRKYCSNKCKASDNAKKLNSKWISSSCSFELKAIANNLIRELIRVGKIGRPKYCSSCKDICKIFAHHPDYTKPNEIIWLCPSCHMKLHFGHNIVGELITV